MTTRTVRLGGTDWVDGTVLDAADLNDTFDSSGKVAFPTISANILKMSHPDAVVLWVTDLSNSNSPGPSTASTLNTIYTSRGVIDETNDLICAGPVCDIGATTYSFNWGTYNNSQGGAKDDSTIWLEYDSTETDHAYNASMSTGANANDHNMDTTDSATGGIISKIDLGAIFNLSKIGIAWKLSGDSDSAISFHGSTDDSNWTTLATHTETSGERFYLEATAGVYRYLRAQHTGVNGSGTVYIISGWS